jgi:signal transduction histidine kinase
LYAREVRRRAGLFASPTAGLLCGLGISLAAVAAYSAYNVAQIRGLRTLQTDLVDRNRRDSLQLLRIQNDLNSLALAMRDMLDSSEPYPLTAWTGQFQRIRADLLQALRLEQQLAAARRSPEQRAYLGRSMAQFWDASDRMFALARAGSERQAREQIRLSLQARQAALSTAVSRLLVENNEAEQEAVNRIRGIYDRIERQVYLFLAATLAAIVLTSLYLIRANRRMFARMAVLSGQRSELAQKLIAAQESTLRYISRELHDDFGQVLTAIGSMLARLERQAPPGDSTLRQQLQEAREAAQATLDKVRNLSQALHPVVLEEAGLEGALAACITSMERQAGLAISYEKEGAAFAVDGGIGIHIYRIVQEALSNAARHSGAREAWVRLRYRPDELQVDVEDRGKGFDADTARRGVGLVAMRERADLMNGKLEFLRPAHGGALVRLTVPVNQREEH